MRNTTDTDNYRYVHKMTGKWYKIAGWVAPDTVALQRVNPESGEGEVSEALVIKLEDVNQGEFICSGNDDFEVKIRMHMMKPTENTTGFLFSDRKTAEAACAKVNELFRQAEQNGIWTEGDAMAWSGCDIEFEVSEEWA